MQADDVLPAIPEDHSISESDWIDVASLLDTPLLLPPGPALPRRPQHGHRLRRILTRRNRDIPSGSSSSSSPQTPHASQHLFWCSAGMVVLSLVVSLILAWAAGAISWVPPGRPPGWSQGAWRLQSSASLAAGDPDSLQPAQEEQQGGGRAAPGGGELEERTWQQAAADGASGVDGGLRCRVPQSHLHAVPPHACPAFKWAPTLQSLHVSPCCLPGPADFFPTDCCWRTVGMLPRPALSSNKTAMRHMWRIQHYEYWAPPLQAWVAEQPAACRLQPLPLQEWLQRQGGPLLEEQPQLGQRRPLERLASGRRCEQAYCIFTNLWYNGGRFYFLRDGEHKATTGPMLTSRNRSVAPRDCSREMLMIWMACCCCACIGNATQGGIAVRGGASCQWQEGILRPKPLLSA